MEAPMRNASFFFLFMAWMLSAQAQAFDEGGLAYTITSSTSPFTVEVTGRASGNSATDINIPDTVTNNGTTYSVTAIKTAAFADNELNALTSVTIPARAQSARSFTGSKRCFSKPHLTLLGPPLHYVRVEPAGLFQPTRKALGRSLARSDASRTPPLG